MSMSSVYYLKAVSPMNMSATPSPSDNLKDVKSDAEKIILTFLLLLVLDLVITIYALYCLFSSHLPWYVTVLLIVLMFTPFIGGITAIGVIIYYNVNKKKSNTYYFEFY